MVKTTFVGDILEGDKKYGAGGVEAKNGCIYMMPFMAQQVLEYNIATGTTRLIGDIIETEETGGLDWKKEDQYDCAVLGHDGMVYGIPCNASKILKVDPTTGTTEFVGDDIGTIECSWRAAVVNPQTGMIYGIPSNAKRILKFNPITEETSFVGPEFDERIEDKWNCGIVSPKDNALYCFPSCMNTILKFNFDTEECEYIGTNNENESNNDNENDFGYNQELFCGAAVDSNGDVYGIPLCSDRIVKLDVDNQTTSYVGPTINKGGEVNFGGGNFVLGKKGLFGNKEEDPNLYLSPMDAKQVCKLNVQTGEKKLVGDVFKGKQKWVHAVNGSDGNLYLIPYMAKQILKIEI